MTTSTHAELIAAASAPFKLGQLELSHRICVAPMTRRRCPDDRFLAGFPDQIAHYTARARGGGSTKKGEDMESSDDSSVPFSLIFTEGTYIEKNLCGSEAIPHLGSEEAAAGWGQVVAACKHASGGKTKMAVQLWHNGRMCTAGGMGPVESEFTLAPPPSTSSYASSSSSGSPPQQQAVVVRKVRALSRDEIETIAKAFAKSAQMAVEIAGFDVIAIHGAHGYLLDSFISKDLNTRDDSFGGPSLENRMRFPCLVVSAVKQAIPAHIPLVVRISQWSVLDYEEVKWASSAELALTLRLLVDAGVTGIDVSTRRVCAAAFPDEHKTRSLAGWAKHILCEQLKRPDIAVIGVGSVCVSREFKGRGEYAQSDDSFVVADPSPALQLLKDGDIDLLCVGRAAIADASLCGKLFADRWSEIKPYAPSLLGKYP